MRIIEVTTSKYGPIKYGVADEFEIDLDDLPDRPMSWFAIEKVDGTKVVIRASEIEQMNVYDELPALAVA